MTNGSSSWARKLAVFLQIVVTTSCGGGADAHVTEAPPRPPAEIRVQLNYQDSNTLLMVGDSLRFVAIVSAADGSAVSQSVIWVSAAPLSVSVSAVGLATALQPPGGQICAEAVVDRTKKACAVVLVSPRLYTLDVSQLSGVIGSPVAGTSTYEAGTTINYSFSTASTHENLRVLVDGPPASSSGLVSMTRNHNITAYADKKIVVPPSVQSQVDAATTAMRGVAGAKPLDAYRSVNTAITNLARSVSNDSLVRYIRVARLNGWKGLDATAIARGIREINDSLGAKAAAFGQLGRFAFPQRSASVVQRSVGPLASGAGGILFLYINGINTFDADAQRTATQFLSATVARAGFADPSRFAVDYVYNPTGNSTDIAVLAAQVCMQARADASAEGSETDPYPSCEDLILAVSGTNDLAEAYLQVLLRIYRRVPGTGTAASLVARIASELQSRRVVVVSHSQGNLYVDEAYRALEKMPGVNPKCIGTVSLAPPMPIRPLVGSSAIDASIVSGRTIKDILLQADGLLPGVLPGIQTVPAYTNALSDAVNGAYDVLNNTWVKVLTAGLLEKKRLRLWYEGGVELHSIDRDCLGFNQAVTIAGIQAQASTVLSNCVGQLEVSAPSRGNAGTPIPPVEVRVLGPGSELATEVTTPVSATLVANGAGASLLGSSIVVPVNGIARFDNLIVDRPGTDFKLVFSAGGIAATSPPFDITSGRIDASAGVDQIGTVGQVLPNPIVVLVRDGVSLAPLAGRAVTFTASTGNGAPSSSTVSTGLDGKASVAWTLGTTAGQQVLNASLNNALGSPVTFKATAQAGAASRIEIVSGNNQTGPAGGILPISLRAKVTDQFSNAIPNFSVGWAVLGGGGSLQPSGTLQQNVLTDVNGQSSIQWRLGQGGGTNNNVVTASGTGLSGSPLTFVASGQAASPVKLGFVAQPSNGVAGQALPSTIQVAVQSASGATVPAATSSITLSLGANNNGALLSGVLTRNATDGVASFSQLTVDRAGTFTIVASSPGLTSTTSSSFTVAVAPVATVIVAPASASVTVGGTQQFSVILRDAGGNTLTGRAVSWSSSNPSAVGVTQSGLATGLVATQSPVTIQATAEGIIGTAQIEVVAQADLHGTWQLVSSSGESVPFRLSYPLCSGTFHHVIGGALEIGQSFVRNWVTSRVFSNAAGTIAETVYGSMSFEELGSDAGGAYLIGTDTVGNQIRKRLRQVGSQLELTLADGNCAYLTSNPAAVVTRTYLYSRVPDGIPASVSGLIGRTCDIQAARIYNLNGSQVGDLFVSGLRGTINFSAQPPSAMQMLVTVTAKPSSAPPGYWAYPDVGAFSMRALVFADGSVVHEGTSPPLPIELSTIRVNSGVVTMTDGASFNYFFADTQPGRTNLECRLR